MLRNTLLKITWLTVLSQAALAAPDSFQPNIYRELGKPISTDELISLLSVPVHGQIQYSRGGRYQLPGSFYVGKLVARAKDKNAMVAGTQIRDLQAFNMCTLDDCTKTELGRRVNLCEKLEAGLKAAKESGNVKERDLYKNLHVYCVEAVERSHGWCGDMNANVMARAIKKRFSSATKKSLIDFQRSVQRAGIPLGTAKSSLGNAEIIKQALDSMKDGEREKAVGACRELRTLTRDTYPFYNPDIKIFVKDYDDWLAIDYNCRLVGAKPDGLESGASVEFVVEYPSDEFKDPNKLPVWRGKKSYRSSNGASDLEKGLNIFWGMFFIPPFPEKIK